MTDSSHDCLTPKHNCLLSQSKYLPSIFTMAPTLVRPWPFGHPIRGVTEYLKSQARTNMSAMVCNCSKGVDFLMSVS